MDATTRAMPVLKSGCDIRGRISEMCGWSSGTRGVTRDVPVARDEISDRGRSSRGNEGTKFKASGGVIRLRNIYQWNGMCGVALQPMIGLCHQPMIGLYRRALTEGG